jgi:hypothetical protein
MIAWLESQSVTVIVIIGYTFCFLVAAAAFVAGWLLSRTKYADDLAFITPSLLTPLGVILGLLLVFLSSRVWTNVDRANLAVAQEVSAIQELRRVADELPPALSDSIREGTHAYLEWVRHDDWARMMSGSGSLAASLPGLSETMKTLVEYDASSSGLRNVQAEAMAAVEKVRDARRARILQSRAYIGPGQWLVVLVLYTHVLFVIATVHIRRNISMAVALWMFSSAFAICFVLLVMYDSPFRSGGLTVGPVGIEAPVAE